MRGRSRSLRRTALLGLLASLCGAGGRLGAAEVERDLALPMRDGVRLRADLYQPQAAGPHPTLVYRTPYDKRAAAGSPLFEQALARGWAVLAVDVRGRYASDGDFDPYWNEGRDGFDCIEWAAHQSWSDGRIGSAGLSYPGAVQWLAAVERPPHLRAMVPAMSFSSPRRFFYFGGAFDLSWIGWIWHSIAPDIRVRRGLAGPRDARQAEAAWQREQQRMLDTLPLQALPDLRDVAPFYYEWLRHPPEDSWWDPLELRGRYASVGAAVLNLSGWHDEAYGPEGALTNFSGLVAARSAEASARTRVVIGPWVHGVASTAQRRVGDRDFGPAAAIDYPALVLDFLDQHVRGIQPPTPSPPVRVFVMGADVWRGFDAWPPPAARELRLTLAPAEGRCQALMADPAGDSGEAVFSADPARPVRDPEPRFGARDRSGLLEREDVLCFESAPLPEDLEVIGAVGAELLVSSDAPDLDLWLELLDVTPDGIAWNLWSPGLGVERASAREAGPAPLLRDVPAAIRFPRLATANRFRAGHRIRLLVYASHAPWLSRNLQTGAWEALSAESRPAQVRLRLGASGSSITLPVMP